MKALWLLVLAGCAKGGTDLSDAPSGFVDSFVVVDTSEVVDGAHTDASGLTDGAMIDTSVMVDASPMIDAAHDAMADAAPMIDAMADAAPMIDAMADAAPMPDAMVDAAPMIDAAPMVDAPCTPVTTELLLNPAFDLLPRATDWNELSDSGLDLITNDPGTPMADSGMYRAWLGGVTEDDDELTQNVTIPANTTKLEMTGVYAVGSDETGSTIYDKLEFGLFQTNGTTLVEDVIKLSNVSVTSVPWTPLDHVFSMNLSGQTLQVRFNATNDITNATSFFFDTMSLKATHCP